jgi:hypothetical protein
MDTVGPPRRYAPPFPQAGEVDRCDSCETDEGLSSHMQQPRTCGEGEEVK